jgi:uncharacterized membrane protein YkoI
VAVIAAGTGVAIAAAQSDDGGQAPLSGTTLDRATEAALAYTGGGSVAEAEVGDQGAAYDVAVTRDDGSVADLRLDSNFVVIGEEHDSGQPDNGPAHGG